MGKKPPFRAEHVGSYLRPKQLVVARELHKEGSLGDDELRAMEDACIRDIVTRQENSGLDGITDGEFRRTFFHTDFLQRLRGVTVTTGAFNKAFRRDDGAEVGFRPPTMRVDAPIEHSEPIQGEDFSYLASLVQRTAKVCIPAPSMLHFRGGRQAISKEYYPSLEMFFDDLTAAYRAEISDLAAVAICKWTTPISPISAIRQFANKRSSEATTRTRSRGYTVAWSMTRSLVGPRTWLRQSIFAGAILKARGWPKVVMSQSPIFCLMRWQ